MSYLAFGLIVNAGPLDGEERDALAWKVVRSAQEVGLYVMLANNISQRIATDMLEPALKPVRDRALPFLVTQSPVHDTSDALISPYYAPEQGVDGVLERARPIGGWMKSILALEKVPYVELWMTEGYDPAFETVNVKVHEFENVLSQRIKEDVDISSVRFVITKT